ncbi:MAG TPA: methylated DNA-protein cysteine methyltransferase, partial [Anaerovoracaceae bacterium]|nr:methylated DNA-protein cysteine methyltransferase [Anaerovoracaceae bacterium]
MTNKSYNDKLNDSKDMPKLVDLSDKPDFVARVGGPLMLIAPPLAYNDIMARVPEGKIITSDRIRDYLAKQADANTTCSLTAGIFINICANASFEREDNQIPY